MADNEYLDEIRSKIRNWKLIGADEADIERLRKMVFFNDAFAGDWHTFPPSEIGVSESPIEARLLLEFANSGWAWIKGCNHSVDDVCRFAAKDVGTPVFAQQVEVPGYRLDFLVCQVLESGPLMVCVECDGLEHHYNNLNKIHADNMRIAALARLKIFTARFLGSEIIKSAAECTNTVKAIFEAQNG